MNIDSCFFSSK